MEPALDEMMVKFGRVVSDTDEKVTVCWVVPAFPARSVAPTGISFLPTASVKGHENALPFTAAGTSLQVMLAIPDKESETSPVIVIPACVTVLPFGGAVIVRSGTVLSSRTVALSVAVLPALSVALPATEKPLVSLLITFAAGQESTPLRASVQVKLTVTSVLFQPFAFGCGDRVRVIPGAVLSKLMIAAVEATLPARSLAVPLIDWFAPSVTTLTGEVTFATPERVSVAENVTVTSELFHPFAFAAGDCAAVSTGGVLSRLMSTVAEAWLPAKSTALPVTTCFAPSLFTVTGDGHVRTPLVISEQLKLTVTLELCQPAAFGGLSSDAVITGGTLSIPIISAVKPDPGAPAKTTTSVLVARSVTDRSMTCCSKSSRRTISTPLTE